MPRRGLEHGKRCVHCPKCNHQIARNIYVDTYNQGSQMRFRASYRLLVPMGATKLAIDGLAKQLWTDGIIAQRANFWHLLL